MLTYFDVEAGPVPDPGSGTAENPWYGETMNPIENTVENDEYWINVDSFESVTFYKYTEFAAPVWLFNDLGLEIEVIGWDGSYYKVRIAGTPQHPGTGILQFDGFTITLHAIYKNGETVLPILSDPVTDGRIVWLDS